MEEGRSQGREVQKQETDQTVEISKVVVPDRWTDRGAGSS